MNTRRLLPRIAALLTVALVGLYAVASLRDLLLAGSVDPPPAAVLKGAETSRITPDAVTWCAWHFVEYHPSEVERRWHRKIREYKTNVCYFTNGLYRTTVVDAIITAAAGGSTCPAGLDLSIPDHQCQPQSAAGVGGRRRCRCNASWQPDMQALLQRPDVFSRFEYRNNCSNATRYSPIEPLAGTFRHPNLCRPGRTAFDVSRKDWLIVDPWVVSQTGRVSTTGRNVLLDVGAGSWNATANTNSQQWFWRLFAAMCQQLDVMHLWEPKPDDHNRPTPDQLRGMTYRIYPLAAVAVGEGVTAPLWVLRTQVTPSDYVALKLDADDPRFEEEVVERLLADRDLLRRVDEFFWEHHVRFAEMRFAWGWDAWMGDLEVTVDYLARLRRAGVRAHSWV